MKTAVLGEQATKTQRVKREKEREEKTGKTREKEKGLERSELQEKARDVCVRVTVILKLGSGSSIIH